MARLISIKEKKVLSALYDLGQASASRLAKETLINRTSLYPILDKLMEKGLVSKAQTDYSTVFAPIPVTDFKKWIERKEAEIKKSAEDLSKWVELKQNKKVETLATDFKYLEGFEGVKNLYADTWRNNKGKVIYAVTDAQAAIETMGEFFAKEYWADRVNHGVRVKIIMEDSAYGRREKARAKELLREVKLIKDFEGLGIELNIYDNKVLIVAYDKKLPSGVLIKNPKIAASIKNLFDYIWKA